MLYSPKLKNAMSEILEIINKYDIAALVILHADGGGGDGFGETLLKIDPSYSVAKIQGVNLVKFKARLEEDFKGNRRLMKHKLAATANMLNILGIKAGELSLGVMDISEQFDKIIDVHHDRGESSSQLGLDN